jgi:hypothetical protein
MDAKRTVAPVRPRTVIVHGVRRQSSTLIDVPQLSESELCAVISHGSQSNRRLAWAERKRRGDAVRHFREVLLPTFKKRSP